MQTHRDRRRRNLREKDHVDVIDKQASENQATSCKSGWRDELESSVGKGEAHEIGQVPWLGNKGEEVDERCASNECDTVIQIVLCAHGYDFMDVKLEGPVVDRDASHSPEEVEKKARHRQLG